MPDKKLIEKILNDRYSYYDQYKSQRHIDARLAFPAREFLLKQVDKSMSVLDVGCGTGATLLALAPHIKQGNGIDEAPEFIEKAAGLAATAGVKNLDFVVAKSVQLPFSPNSFDLVFSERGPLAGNPGNIQSGLRVLKPKGMIFAETIGELAGVEEREFFDRGQTRRHEHMTVMEQSRVFFERNGVDIRMAADHFGKMVYADIYAWLLARCAVASYFEGEPPYGLDVETVEAFEKGYAAADGSLTLTTHVVWIAGVKQAQPPEYWEYQHFPKEGHA